MPPAKINYKLQLIAFLLLLLFTALTAPSAARAAIAPVKPASDDRGVYLLSEPGHLVWFRDTVNNVSADIDAKLMNDIDLSESSSPSHWTPAGRYTGATPDGYAGSFDGGGFTVSGYIVTGVVSMDDRGGLAAGFFGLVGHADISGNTKSISTAGGIAGLNNGTITDCVHSGGDVSASGGSTNNYAGGIAGYNDYSGTITNNAHSGGTVSAYDGTSNCAGGIVGYNDSGKITNSCWPASGDLKAIGNGAAVSADVVALDAAEMKKVVTTVLPVERSLSVEVGGSAPALISYPARRTIWRATSPSAEISPSPRRTSPISPAAGPVPSPARNRVLRR